MEVASIANNITIPKVNPNNSIDAQPDTVKTAVNTNNLQFDYSKVMMDLEEVQDFLFMLIGEQSPGKNEKGEKLNLLA